MGTKDTQRTITIIISVVILISLFLEESNDENEAASEESQ
jgi:hypothetical protein